MIVHEDNWERFCQFVGKIYPTITIAPAITQSKARRNATALENSRRTRRQTSTTPMAAMAISSGTDRMSTHATVRK